MLLKTTSMEAAAHILHSRFHRVLISTSYRLYYPIRLRSKLLADIKPYFSYTYSPESYRQIALWRENGGTLIDCNFYPEPVIQDAMMFCEAPFNLEMLARQNCLLVVYRPPTWLPHRQELPRIFPPASICRRFERLARDATLDSRSELMFKTLGFDTAGVGAMPRTEIIKRLGIEDRPNKINNIMHNVFRRFGTSHITVRPLIPNVEPEDKNLMPLYQAIVALPSMGGVRLAVNNELGKALVFWRKGIRRLAYYGSIRAFDPVEFFHMHGVHPDYKLIQFRHEQGKVDLDQLIDVVNDAPELTLEAVENYRFVPPAPPRPSIFLSPPADGERFGDTTH